MRAALLIVTGALACAPPATDERGATIIGGDRAGPDGAVALLGDSGPCSAVLIAPRVVATAAHCARGSIAVAIGDAAPWRDTIAVEQIARVRGGVDGAPGDDLALGRLARPASVAPIAIRTAGLDEVNAVIAVGFGRAVADDSGSGGVRRSARLGLSARTATTLTTDGAGPAFTCAGDSGAPALDDAGAAVALVVAGDPACAGPSILARLDVRAAWIADVIAAWDGPCAADGTCVAGCATIDPDCDPCGFDGRCVAGCPAPDLDCPPDAGPGATCGDDGDCESRACIAAPDDPAVRFCSQACADDGASCPAPLGACAAGACVYAGPTPGAFGAACGSDDACRSGLCDRAVGACSRPCAEGCPLGYACGGDAAVCRLIDRGCAAGGGGLGLASLIATLAALISARRASGGRTGRRGRRR